MGEIQGPASPRMGWPHPHEMVVHLYLLVGRRRSDFRRRLSFARMSMNLRLTAAHAIVFPAPARPPIGTVVEQPR